MSIQESMAKVVKDSRVPIGRTQRIDLITEWKKWLAYDPDFQVRRRKSLYNREVITRDDALFLCNLNYYASILDLMDTYDTELISIQNQEKVDMFLQTHSIKEYMESKLTKDELEYANYMIKEYMSLPNDELQARISNDIKLAIYQRLSMVDSYILHVIIDRQNQKELDTLEEKVVYQYWLNKGVRQRNLYNVDK